MDQGRLRALLDAVKRGERSVEDAVEALARLPFADIGGAVVDHHREIRTGFPEVIFGEPKGAVQIIAIAAELARTGGNVLVTRVEPAKAAAVIAVMPAMRYAEEARCLVLEQREIAKSGAGPIAIVTAGTADAAVAEEAALVARLAGNEILRISDVGVAGVHRLLHRLDDLRRATVIVAVAGMEGALPSVIAGLVAAPVIAVPTSVGYGASFGGIAALLGMLSSCAAGVTVVNIDNGFGAGCAAALVNRVGGGAR
jgi:pyridinium-3,5-biscarboxylic acid mononucleotide synthase